MDLKTLLWLFLFLFCLVGGGDAGKGRKAGRHGKQILDIHFFFEEIVVICRNAQIIGITNS